MLSYRIDRFKKIWCGGAFYLSLDWLESHLLSTTCGNTNFFSDWKPTLIFTLSHFNASKEAFKSIEQPPHHHEHQRQWLSCSNLIKLGAHCTMCTSSLTWRNRIPLIADVANTWDKRIVVQYQLSEIKLSLQKILLNKIYLAIAAKGQDNNWGGDHQQVCNEDLKNFDKSGAHP